MLKTLFGTDKNTDLLKEVTAGVTTFLTMSYILIVNPLILSDAGMDKEALITATGLAAAFGTLLMALWVKAPLAMAPGMGLNAFFAYSLVLGEGISWQTAMGVVFISGIVFLLLTVIGIREKIVNAIPLSLRLGIPVGIGFFITFIGFQNMGLVVKNEATIVALGKFTPELIIALIGLMITFILEAKKIKGALLVGIAITTIIALVTGHVEWQGTLFSTPPSLEPIAFQLDIFGALSWGLVGAIFSFMFVDLFDSVGTLVGCSYEAEMVEEDGTIKKIDKMLEADAVATVAGSLMGTSTTTTFIESASGIEEGGRTGLTSFVTAILFLVALFFSPLISFVPSFATAPILVVVGIFMFRNIGQISLDDWTELVPVFLTAILMPVTYSISTGLTFGFLSWIFLKIGTARFKEITPIMWFIGALSLLNLVISGM